MASNIFLNIQVKSYNYFPDVSIRFKDSSPVMKALSKILFFNKKFMTDYITTLGNTIYFPNKETFCKNDFNTSIIYIHELIHMYDSKKLNRVLFTFLYLFPQILSLITIPLLFISWKFIFMFLLLLPIPSISRAYFEKKAYTFSLYVMNYFNKTYQTKYDLYKSSEFYASQFYSPYYYMMPFKFINKYFDKTVEKIIAGERPGYNKKIYDMVDDILS